ncbi:GDP-L-fucose synthase family protein [Fretibacter rubidus]|uniref:GDP-L-fucose synthase family protein n=1 Tax=Fretibacter rubidus TaxID=570162 RepID=UPI00352B44CA
MAQPTLFLTGGNGMVGRNIRGSQHAGGWNIVSPSRADLDLTDGKAVAGFIKDLAPDLVVHSAGKVGGIAANMASPVQFLDDNLLIGRNVIMGAMRADVPKLINLASTCVYPREAENPLSEDQILEGRLEPTNEGYALAKIAALRLCEYIGRERPELQYKTLIPCNLFGKYDKFDPHNSHLIPAIIHKVHMAKRKSEPTVEIWGSGEARREFMYAEDLADFILEAAPKIDSLPALMNTGVGVDHSINDYYDTVAKVIGWTGEFTHDLSRPVGMNQKLCSTARQTQWGWQPPTSLEQGIEKTYAFYLTTPYADL